MATHQKWWWATTTRPTARARPAATQLPDLAIGRDKAVDGSSTASTPLAIPTTWWPTGWTAPATAWRCRSRRTQPPALEAAATATGNTTPLAKNTVYEAVVDARTMMSKMGVPNDNKRFCWVSPGTYALVLNQRSSCGATALGEVQWCRPARRAASLSFNVFEDATPVSHHRVHRRTPDWCTRVHEWMVGVHLQDLGGSGSKYIGASAVQGRKIYTLKVTKPQTLLIKRNAAPRSPDTEALCCTVTIKPPPTRAGR